MWMIGAVLTSGAQAQDAVGDSAVTVLLGTNTAFDGDPATFRLGVQGEADLTHGRAARLALAVPVTWMTAGEERFGITFTESVLEIPPSLRVRLLPELPVRPYGDLGLGVAFASASTDGWLFADRDQVAGWMSRAAVGVEIGQVDGLVVMVEPFSLSTYHFGDDYVRAGGTIGVGSRF